MTTAPTAPRVVVTGMAALTPVGLGLDEHWRATLAGRSGLAPLTDFDTSDHSAHIAGRIRDFDAARHLPSRLLPQTDVSTRFALAAAEQALKDAAVGPDTLPDYEMGAILSLIHI